MGKVLWPTQYIKQLQHTDQKKNLIALPRQCHAKTSFSHKAKLKQSGIPSQISWQRLKHFSTHTHSGHLSRKMCMSTEVSQANITCTPSLLVITYHMLLTKCRFPLTWSRELTNYVITGYFVFTAKGSHNHQYHGVAARGSRLGPTVANRRPQRKLSGGPIAEYLFWENDSNYLLWNMWTLIPDQSLRMTKQ